MEFAIYPPRFRTTLCFARAQTQQCDRCSPWQFEVRKRKREIFRRSAL